RASCATRGNEGGAKPFQIVQRARPAERRRKCTSADRRCIRARNHEIGSRTTGRLTRSILSLRTDRAADLAADRELARPDFASSRTFSRYRQPVEGSGPTGEFLMFKLN